MDLLTIVLVFIVYAAKAQEICRTPNGQNGKCILLHECDAWMKIAGGPRPIPQATLNLFKASQCGFIGSDAKICCDLTASDITTPNPPDVRRHPNLRLIIDNICGPIIMAMYGGIETNVLQHPWMAFIEYRNNRGGQQFGCGGTIINKRYILTAAHCVTGLPNGLTPIGVRVGEHDVRTERDCDRNEQGYGRRCPERYYYFNIENIQFHENFTFSSMHNDIALIRVNADIDFRPLNVKPICLPIGTAAELNSKWFTVEGWGRTEFGRLSPKLLRLSVPLVTNQECAKVFKHTKEISYKQICAGGLDRRAPCYGDSGGPLYAEGVFAGTRHNVQYGIVSYSLMGCGTAGEPDVFTRVEYYLDWILNHIRE